MSAKDEVRAVIERFFKAMDTRDLALMKQLLSKDESMVHIGSARDEIWSGWTELMEVTEDQFRELEYYKASIYDLTVNLSRSRDTAWYFHKLDARIKSGVNETTWKGARFTGVLERKDGNWKLMQTHVSIPESGS